MVFSSPDPCADAGCDKTCEVVDGKAVCKCPDNMVLGADEKSCTGRFVMIFLLNQSLKSGLI